MEHSPLLGRWSHESIWKLIFWETSPAFQHKRGSHATGRHRRREIPEAVWKKLEPLLPGREGAWGEIAYDKRQFIDAVFWIMRTGAPWRDKGVWEKLPELFLVEPDFARLTIDASHCTLHPHAAGARGGLTQHRACPWIRVLLPLRAMSAQAPAADWKQAIALLDGLSAQYPLVDRGFDSNALLCQAAAQGMPSKKQARAASV